MQILISSKKIRRPGFRDVASALAMGVAALTLPVGFATPAHAQEVNASLRGKITVEGGASQVTIIDVNSGITRSTPLGTDGSYNFASLRPGTYRLEVTTPAGVRKTDSFTLLVAQNAVLDFNLGAPPAESAEGPSADGDAIVVVGNRIRTMEGGEVGLNITQREIETLPQNNRNFLAFADLAPGVQFVTNGQRQSRLQGGAQDSRTVNVFIDGVGQKDYVLKNGVTGQDSTVGNPFPQTAVAEYRVISSNYKAEFDQVSSVAVTAVTRSGTNEFHGEGFVEYSDEHLRAKTPSEKFSGSPLIPTKIDVDKTPRRDLQFGGSLGGPIIRDKLFFFGTVEFKRIDEPLDIFPNASANNIANIPAEFNDEFGSFSQRFNENLYFGKLDFAPNTADLFQGTFKYRRETGDGISSGSGLRSLVTDQNVTEYRGLLRWERTADNWINDLKLTYEDARWHPTPRFFENSFRFEDSLGRQIFQNGGGSNFQDQGQKGWSIQNDFTWTGSESHTIKAGVKAKWIKLRVQQFNLFNPVYTFNTQYNGATWNDTIPWRVQFGFDSGLGGDPVVVSKNFQLGLYVQDDWEVTDRLTLNLGIRWDYDRTPAWVNFETTQASLNAISPANFPGITNANYDINDYITDGNDRKTFKGAFQPRIGFSYEIDPEHQFVVFGGYGRSYDRNQFSFIQQETSVGAFTTRTFRFQVPGDTRNNCGAVTTTCVPWDPIYLTEAGRAQLAAAAGALGGAELRFINNHLKIPYSDQFSLGVRRQFGLINGEVGYTHISSRDGFAWLLGNRRPDGSFFLPPPTNQDSPFSCAQCTPAGRGNLILGDNGLETNSDSVYVKLVKRYSRNSPWNLTATYTYTKAEENRQFGETFSLDFPSIEDYPFLFSRGVPKHRFIAAGSVDLPFDFLLSGKLTLESPPFGTGFNNVPGTGERIIQGIFANNRHPFIIGDFWAKRQLDLALTKYFALPFLSKDARIRVRADVFNVLDEENFVNYNFNARDNNPNDVNGSFGDVANFGIGGNVPRTFKFTLGYEF